MCSRFYVDVNLRYVLERIKSLYGLEGYQGAGMIKTGDVRPSEKALVINKNSMSESSGPPFILEWMTWGFLTYRKNNQLLINARVESADEKPAFRSSFRSRRCVIPASGFYEWDKEKNKADFKRADGDGLLMAGCYDMFDNRRRFTVFTAEANGSVMPVHERMPLIISIEDLPQWMENYGSSECSGAAGRGCSGYGDYRALMKKPMPELACRREYEQMSLLL